MGTSSAAVTELAVWLSNSLANLAPTEAPPRYGFPSDERRDRAYALAGAIVGHVNARLLLAAPSDEG